MEETLSVGPVTAPQGAFCRRLRASLRGYSICCAPNTTAMAAGRAHTRTTEAWRLASGRSRQASNKHAVYRARAGPQPASVPMAPVFRWARPRAAVRPRAVAQQLLLAASCKTVIGERCKPTWMHGMAVCQRRPAPRSCLLSERQEDYWVDFQERLDWLCHRSAPPPLDRRSGLGGRFHPANRLARQDPYVPGRGGV